MPQQTLHSFGVIIGLLSVFGVTAAGPAAAGQSATHPFAQDAALRPGVSGSDALYGTSDFIRRRRGDVDGDHFAVALRVSQCYPDISDPSSWSPAVQTLLQLKRDHIRIMAAQPNSDSAGHGSDRELPAMNPFHTAAIAYSERVSRDRMDFGRDFEDNRDASTQCQYLLIGLGALATILVGLRAIVDGLPKWPKIMSAAAIIVSALVTAVSSLTNFEGFTAIAVRDLRSLTQLQQLHWRIASDVLQHPELCTRRTPGVSDKGLDVDTLKAMEVVNAWRTRLEGILDSATESISKPGDISNGKEPSKPDTGSSPPPHSEQTVPTAEAKTKPGTG